MSGSRYWSEGVMLSFSSPNHRKTTYMRSAWDRDHLPLNLATVVRVLRKGFCCSPDGSGPEEKPLCSKTPDEDAFVLRIILLIRQRNGQCTARECSQENGLGGADCCDMLQLHAHCAN